MCIIINEKRVKFIINLSSSSLVTKYKLHNVNELNIPIDYRDDDDIMYINNVVYDYIYDIIENIHENLLNNHVVLLIGHNYRDDVNVITCSYFIKYGMVDVSEAVKYLQSKKSNVFIRRNNFEYCLSKVYMKTNKQR